MTSQNLHRRLSGTVVSDAMDKTLVVAVGRTVLHKKYGKRLKRETRYHVHDEQKAYHLGDVVEFEECRPLSRLKRWTVVRKMVVS